jgi:response regulator RpfG family c-di-GMP phosphodiesterase
MTMIMRADDGVGQKAGRRDTADGQWTPRLLIAGDVPANIDLLMRILGSAGYHDIVSTTDGRAVVTTFQAAQPDIVLLDLHMPQVDGLGIIHELKSATRGVPWLPVIVLTGDPSVEARRSCLSAGASDVIGKPYDMSEVVLRVRNLLETRRLHLALAGENEVLEQRDDDTGEHTRRVGVLGHHRVYRGPVPHSEVMQMIEQGAGTQFDPAVVRAMLAIGRAAAALDA